MQVTQIGEWKLTEDELDDIECGMMTVDEIRALIDTDIISDNIAVRLDQIQETVLSGKYERRFILIKVE